MTKDEAEAALTAAGCEVIGRRILRHRIEEWSDGALIPIDSEAWTVHAGPCGRWHTESAERLDQAVARILELVRRGRN
jgi:hypothetical protein